METTIVVIAFIILMGILVYQQAVINKLKREKAIEDGKDTIIALQKQTIDNQSATIKNYKDILGKGVEIKS